jgi:hypothetical protein
LRDIRLRESLLDPTGKVLLLYDTNERILAQPKRMDLEIKRDSQLKTDGGICAGQASQMRRKYIQAL